MQYVENAADIIEKERPFDRASNRYILKIFRKLTFVPTMAIVIGIALTQSGISFSLVPANDLARTDTDEPSLKAHKSRQDSTGKDGPAVKSKE